MRWQEEDGCPHVQSGKKAQKDTEEKTLSRQWIDPLWESIDLTVFEGDDEYEKWNGMNPFKDRPGNIMHKALGILATNSIPLVSKFLGLSSVVIENE